MFVMKALGTHLIFSKWAIYIIMTTCNLKRVHILKRLIDQAVIVICNLHTNEFQGAFKQNYHGSRVLPGGGRPSFMLNAVANIPKGNAPIPKDIWKPPSPNPNP